jgi:hypothetical protein
MNDHIGRRQVEMVGAKALVFAVVGRMRGWGRFLWRWITVLIPAAVIVLAAASGATNGHYTIHGHKLAVAWTLIVIAAVLAVFEMIVVGRRQLSIEVIDRERRQFAGRAESAEHALMHLMRAELIDLQERADLFSGERVSLFRCDGEVFTLVARRSPMPIFDQSLGRLRYPVNQGVLDLAWRQNTAGIESLPEPGDEPMPRRRWLDAQKKLNIPDDVASAFVMRSQSYAAFRIAERDRSLGVIVFESTVSVDEAKAAGGTSPTKRTVAELEPLVKEASARLADLLNASSSIPAERVRLLLDAQQGPASRQPQTQP